MPHSTCTIVMSIEEHFPRRFLAFSHFQNKSFTENKELSPWNLYMSGTWHTHDIRYWAALTTHAIKSLLCFLSNSVFYCCTDRNLLYEVILWSFCISIRMLDASGWNLNCNHHDRKKTITQIRIHFLSMAEQFPSQWEKVYVCNTFVHWPKF